MANYVFETMTATDAANFTSTDRLFFESATVGSLGVVDTPATTGPLSSTAESITLTSGTHSETFSAAQLSYASTHGGLIFVNGDELFLGTGTGQTITLTDAGHGHSTAAYGFDGDDTITGTSAANDTLNGGAGNDVIVGSSSYTDASHHWTESDYYMGGAGNDTITGGVGNDHIYGNLFSSTAGAADGNDLINAGNGNDYVNGNAGDDTIHGGNDNDKLYGGAGNDVITGDAGNDYLQGNKGQDTLDGGDGNDTLHGGAGNDLIFGDDGVAGNDQLFGDNGDDTLIGGLGYDSLWGGAGNDLFVFTTGDASNANLLTASTAAGHDVTDVIMDFTDGSDVITLTFPVDHVYHQQTGVTFTSVDAAQVYAEQLLDAATAAGNEVAAIQVGADTYLFYNDTNHAVTGVDAAHSINSVIKVAGVAATAFDSDGSDFV
jgi:Ca2+-binding RTX toxin-like protein